MDNIPDLLQKRAIFYQKVHELNQAFKFYDPRIRCEILKIFGTSFYGSMLWSLFSDEHLKLNRSWNTAVKMIWDLPIPTHKRFVESLTNVPHLQSTLHGRYIGFLKSLQESLKPQMTMLINYCVSNQNSNTGKNIEYLLTLYQKGSVSSLIDSKFDIKRTRVSLLLEN